MAAPVDQSNSGSSGETVGISYADAVINFRNNGENNKENINSTIQPKIVKEKTVKAQQTGSSNRANKQPAFATNKAWKQDDFPQINSRPNRFKQGDRDKKQNNQNHNDNEITNIGTSEKSKGSAKAKPSEASSPPTVEKIKYIEAPLPKVNPWTIKRNSINSIPSAPLSTVISNKSEKDNDMFATSQIEDKGKLLTFIQP